MSIEFARPLRLLLIPACAAAILLTALRRRSRSRKERISHILRYATVILTVLALSGTSLLTASPDRAAWLLVDVSASMPEGETLALARRALQASGGDRKTGVIVFGRDAAVERSLDASGDFPGGAGEIHSAVHRDGSDLGEALALAAALTPGEMNAGIAVISDGKVSGTEAYLKNNPDIPVNTLHTAQETGPDAQVTAVDLPATLYTGQRYTTMVTVHANTAGEATLALSENHGDLRTQTVQLRKGENTFAFDSVASSGGVIPCEARIMLPGDTVSGNDAGGAFTTVSGAASVLIAESRPGEGDELRKMLESASMNVTVISAAMLSEKPSDLWAYEAIALVNADAADMTEAQTAALDSAVREMGCGLAVFGGDSSYALGGYRGSALEKMLPVRIDVRNKLDLPTTALVIAIDKSGSMADETWGMNRLELAREAACSALEVLNERDFAGVIAFDDAGKWVIPLTQVTDPEGMKAQIRTIRLGGGTAFYSPMVMAYEALKNAGTRYRHLIFLTDGEAGDTGYMDVVREMAENGITVTTVAVGDGADYAGMRAIAELGGGRMYTAGPFDSLPKIFTKETMLISGSYVQNRTFTPVVTDASMTDFPGFPALTGYLATTEKPLATVSLCSDRQDPILAWWQYGAGRTAAWTSDVRGGWSESFLNWDRAADFFGGIISWILPVHTPSGVSSLEDGKLRFTVSADAVSALSGNGPDEAGDPSADILDTASAAEARITRPDGSRETVILEQVSADTFEGAAETDQAGAYALHITVKDREGREILSADSGAVVSWTAEYDLRGGREDILEELSAATGGKAADSPEELADFPDTAARKRRDLTPWLMLAAGMLFLFDIAQRRLDLFREAEKKKAGEETAAPKNASRAGRKKEKKLPDPPQAAQVLFQNMQKKKRL